MQNLKPIDYAILSALMKNSKISDRQLAKQIGVSQPTVTRRRARMEKERLLDYTAIPDFAKLGFEILAFTYATSKKPGTPDEQVPKAKSFFDKRDDVIFVSTGSGNERNRMNISLHRSYSDYVKFARALEKEWGDSMTNRTSFIVSLKGDTIIRNLTFKHLGDYIKTNP
jgi:DNA-binding Lrp family transcriptional regulator